MVPPPALAERLLRWSLPDDDRDVVLGDLQEEFVARAAESGRVHARHWYWQQTLLSIGPNLVRRVRRQQIARRRLETDEDRELRLKARKWGGALLVLGIPLLFLAADRDSDAWGITSVVLVLFGTAGFFGSFVPRRPRDAFAVAVSQRRYALFWACYWLSHVGEVIFGKTHLVVELERAPLWIGAAILFWPRKYWIFGSSFVPRAPQIRTPFVGSHRARDGSLWLTVDAPRRGVSLGDPILVRAGDRRIGIDRTFVTTDSLRVYAAVGEGAEPPTAILEVLDSSSVVKMSRPAQLHAVELVREKDPTREPRIPLAQIDESIELGSLEPGDYRLRLTLSDSERKAETCGEFRVVPR